MRQFIDRSMIRIMLLLASFGLPADATEPLFINAEIRPLGNPTPNLERAFAALLERDDGPAWVSYTVPMIAGRRSLCCGGPSRCFLERSENLFVNRSDETESSRDLRVLLRISHSKVTKIRVFSSGCRLDAGGLPVYHWQHVKPLQSLEFLIERATAANKESAESALMAMAHHGHDEADHIFERIARGALVPRFEEEAIFWLGETRGDVGFEALDRLRHELQDEEALEHIAFALHLSEASGALPALIDMARSDMRSDVRSKALFWLSQQAGERATAAIVEASEQDPDLEVKEHAIFALSQLPPERGVPLLIRYAQTHDSHEIRKKAMFWLGQTKDPRALDFFEDILTR